MGQVEKVAVLRRWSSLLCIINPEIECNIHERLEHEYHVLPAWTHVQRLQWLNNLEMKSRVFLQRLNSPSCWHPIFLMAETQNGGWGGGTQRSNWRAHYTFICSNLSLLCNRDKLILRTQQRISHKSDCTKSIPVRHIYTSWYNKVDHELLHKV